MNMLTSAPHVTVIGGGLVGSLNACYLARRGFNVHLYEYRPDIRTSEHVRGRSINMVLSERGRHALRRVGLEEKMFTIGTPIYGRMVHEVNGRCRSVPYGKPHQFILSIERRRLNAELLNYAEKMENVALHFQHKFTSCDLDMGEVTFQLPDGCEVRREAPIILGNDGAYSTVRSQTLMKQSLFNYSQEYISHGYKELSMSANNVGQFAMAGDHLHIWPRGQFMLVAVPNMDRTFTILLFMPFEFFKRIETNDELVHFFRSNFSDSVELIGEDRLVRDYFDVAPQPMVSIKCDSYHYGNKLLLMGDAAHAMVPFYGQGMNAGFEDCLILDDMLTEFKDEFGAAFASFSRHRVPDAHAICDLAMYNYVEMRELVTTPTFLVRKKLDDLLHYLFPSVWVPLYTSVSFTRIRYHQCVLNKRWQDDVITNIMRGAAWLATISLTITSVSLIHKYFHRTR